MPPRPSRTLVPEIRTDSPVEGESVPVRSATDSKRNASQGVDASTTTRRRIVPTGNPRTVSTSTSARANRNSQKTGGTAVPAKRGGRSRLVDGSIDAPPRRLVDEAATPGVVSTPTNSRTNRNEQQTGATGAALKQTRREQRPEAPLRRKGLGDDEKKPGTGLKSASGVRRPGAVPIRPHGRLEGPGTNRSASPSMSAGLPQREKGARGSNLQDERSESRQGTQRRVQRNVITPDLQAPLHPSRTVRSVTPSKASSTTPRITTVRSSVHSQESHQPPRNTACLTLGAQHAGRSRSPGGFVPSRTPSPGLTDSELQHGSSYNATSSSTVTSIGTSYFAGAHGLNIQNQHITTNNLGSSKALFDYFKPHISPGAAYDSWDRRDAPACHEDTRVAIQGNVVGWFKEEKTGGEAGEIMWLSGPAGSGKSAIAGSVAKTCKEEGILAATFFFSSFSPSMDRRWSRGLIATLVHHMSQHKALDQFSSQLLIALEGCPDIFDKTLEAQAEQLILGPFQSIPRGAASADWPKAVIVDGIDEVVAQDNPDHTVEEAQQANENDQVEVLKVLLTLSQSPHFPFRIFVASRPERNITDFFDEPTIHPFTVPLFLDSKYKPDADIEQFLWSKFAQIRRRFRLSDASWPGQEAVGHIVEMSSGQFIVPTTVIRWIESGMPKQQLDEVLKLRRDNAGSKNPFESLDALYHHILMRARTPDGDAHLVVKWIKAINSSMSFGFDNNGNVKAAPAEFWRSFIEDEEGELDYRLAPISSLISIPPPHDTKSPITFYHKSLIDYLSNPTRCSELYVGKDEVDSFVSGRIVVVLKHRGPRVPLLPPQRLDAFLPSLRDLYLVQPPGVGLVSYGTLLEHVATFLDHLGGEELDTLALCNVAWWARLLTQQPGIRVDLSSFVCAIYFGIHKASKCTDVPRREGLLARQAAQEEEKPGCHPACVHWRTGILAQVKELGWCTHRLEAILLHKLQDVTFDQVLHTLSGVARQGCLVCIPMTYCSWYDQWNPEEDKVLGISYDKRLGWYVPL